eukprot:g29302.t1
MLYRYVKVWRNQARVGLGKARGQKNHCTNVDFTNRKTYPANTLTTQNTSLPQKLPSQSKNRNQGKVRGVMVTTSPCST